jgi:ABC-2 type transport system permease protein
MQLKWRGREAWLRVFDDSQAWPSETEVSIVLKRLQGATMPKVGFVTGNLERDINKMNDRDYAVLTNSPFFRYSMVNQGFDVQTVSLEAGPVPAEISALVLADPKLDLPPAARAALSEYINRGGNLLIAGEPGRQAQMNGLLKDLGVQLTEGTLMQESEDETPLLTWQQLAPFAGTFYRPLDGAAKDSIPVTMPGAAGITWTDSSAFAIHPLLQSPPKVSWNRRKPFDPETMVAALVKPKDTALGKSAPGLITFAAADGDVMGPVTTAVGLTRTIHNKEQRIIVTGDADFMNNKEVNRFGTANFVFCTGSFRWLTGGEYPIDASRPSAKDKRINVTLSQAEVLRIVYVWIVPGLLLAFGTILLIRRKRK